MSSIRRDTLYLGDNGRCYCGEHLGTSARYTGRDLSGQPVEPVTPEAAREAMSMGVLLTCDEPRCHRTPSLLHTL